MSELKTRKIFKTIGELNIVNRDVFCEATQEWFNEVECFIDITRDDGTYLIFPNKVEAKIE